MLALQLTDIRKSFGATRALAGVSLSVAPGEVHALIGENGAGKSTLMKILSGAVRPDSGTLHLGGAPYAPASPHDARVRGVAMIYQELNLALHLTAAENIMLGVEPGRVGWIDHTRMRERARAALAQLGHETLPLDRPAREFSIAEQQIIEIARALVLSPKVLIMDEPTSSLTRHDVERLFATIVRLRDQGVAVIYISHFLEECRQLASRFTVLKDGESVATGEMATVTTAFLVNRMTGREVTDLYPRHGRSLGEVTLRARALGHRRRVRDVSFELRAGEIFGLGGLIGAGRTECLRALFGLEPDATGMVWVEGQTGDATPAVRWAQGVGFVSENRKEEGLMLSQPVADNLTLTKTGAFGRLGWVSGRRQAAAAARWIGELGIKCGGPWQPVRALSGGNQQKVALARLLEHPSRIFLLDEPTRGIDVGSKAQIYQLIGRLAAEGKAVIVVSSYLPELLGLCDTIGVMCRGELVAVRPRAEWDEEEIIRVATGGEGQEP